MFAFLGIFNSALFPNFVSILSNWFEKKNRGVFIGFWATANNFGNIVGIQLSAVLLTHLNNNWGALLLIIACWLYGVAAIIFLLMVPEPEKIGLEVAQEDIAETLIHAIKEDKVDEMVTRHNSKLHRTLTASV